MKVKILEAIAKIVMLNIQKLWDPPIAEEQFVMYANTISWSLFRP